MTFSPPPAQNSTILGEGQVIFDRGDAFFQPKSRLSRDLGVLAAQVYRQRTGHLRLLEVMAGSGVRSLRYWQESGADELWVNDANPQLQNLLAQNLAPAIAQKQVRLTCQDAKRIFCACHLHQDYYDFVDLDSFGSPASYFGSVLGSIKLGGLLYLTSTDGRSLTGHDPQNCLQDFGGYARSHPAAKEQAIRILLGSLQQQAAREGRGIEPIFSLVSGQSFRILVQLTPQTHLNAQNYGFLGYCHACGDFQSLTWHSLHQSLCPACRERSLLLSGPLWLGNLHQAQYLQAMMTQAQIWNWHKIVNFLELMKNEIGFPPYCYTLGEIGRRGKIDIPARSQLIQSLIHADYPATPSAIDPQAIKTNASLTTCLAIARNS